MKTNPNIRVQWLAVVVGLLLLIVKFAAYFWTNSNAILTDALESIVNVLAGGFTLVSLYFAALPKDRNHPYGHGKIEFLSAAFEGGLIVLAGISMVVKVAYNLFNPIEIKGLDIGIVLIGAAGIVNYGMGWLLIQQGEKGNSLALKAGGAHLQSDAYSTVGLFLGLGLMYCTQIYWLDHLMAIVFGVIIGVTGFQILRKALAGIMDEYDKDLLQSLVKFLNLNRKENWVDVHNLRIIQYGEAIHIDCHLTLPWYFDLREVHDEVKNFEDLVRSDTERTVELFVHTDPCLPLSACGICSKKDCSRRQMDFQKQVDWTLDNVLENCRHGL